VHGYPSVKVFVNGKFHEDYKQVCTHTWYTSNVGRSCVRACVRVQPALQVEADPRRCVGSDAHGVLVQGLLPCSRVQPHLRTGA
jgi:hypothetical protein